MTTTLEKGKTGLRKGDQAVGFTLPAEPGQPIDVGEHIGKDKVILLFFPLAFSPEYTTAMCHVREHGGRWESLGVKVLGRAWESAFGTP